jgi:hypothetical protein
MFLSVYEAMTELELPWTEFKGVTTGGAPSITGNKMFYL